MPFVVFGAGMFGKDGAPLKGQKSGVVNILWKELKKREANGEVVVVKIDEYLTSQVRPILKSLHPHGYMAHPLGICF